MRKFSALSRPRSAAAIVQHGGVEHDEVDVNLDARALPLLLASIGGPAPEEEAEDWEWESAR